jgi:hypothetical protein
MKPIKKAKYLLQATLVIAVALAFVLPSSAVITNTTQNQQSTSHSLKVTAHQLQSNVLPSGRGDDIQLSQSGTGDNEYPSITIDQEGRVVISWTNNVDLSTSNMGVAYSATPTDPTSWAGWIIAVIGTSQIQHVDTAYIQGPEPTDFKGLYGVFCAPDVSQVGAYTTTDVSVDPSDTTVWSFLSWNGAADQPDYSCIADGPYYYEPYSISGIQPYWGPVNMFIYHYVGSGYDISGCPLYYNLNIRDQTLGSVFFFDGQTHLKTAPAQHPDMTDLSDNFQLTWQYNNNTGAHQIVWKKIKPSVEADIEYTPYQQYLGEGLNPAISAYGNNTAVVWMDGAGVTCAHSADAGTTWTTSTIAATGSYPDICAVGSKFYCAYIANGNLFLVNSTDGGATWSAPFQVNHQDGTVVAEENAVDVHQGGIVWVDNRNGEKDVFYSSLAGSPPPQPKPEFTIDIAGGKGITVTVTNTGKGNATNIAYTVNIAGGFWMKTRDFTGTEAALASGANFVFTEKVMGIGLGILKKYPIPTITVSLTCAENVTAAGVVNAKIMFSKVTIQ